MLAFGLRRAAQALLTLVVVSAAVFTLSRLTGSPVDTLLPLDATAADRRALTIELGLDRPLPVQYGIFLAHALHGDFGDSLRLRRPVTELVGDRLGNSV